jgi:hypothetical protein
LNVGYYTNYGLTVEPPVPDLEGIAQSVGGDLDWFHISDDGWDGNDNESTKWYDHEADMKKLSSLLPGVKFTLSGSGEEQGDVWEKVFQDGERKRARRAKVVMEDV